MVKNNKSEFSDEDLMAFADGQCDAALKARIELASKADPAVMKRVEMFRSGAQLLKKAFKPIADQRADDALAQLIRSTQSASAEARGKVVQFPMSRKPQSVVWRQAIAASVLLAIGLAGGYLIATPQPGQNAPTIALAPSVQSLLSTLPSGSASRIGNEEIVLIASFKDEQGRFCREFERVNDVSEKSVAVACQRENTWRLLFQVAMPVSTDSFVPAGGEKALEAFFVASGMSEPLAVEAEAGFLR